MSYTKHTRSLGHATAFIDVNLVRIESGECLPGQTVIVRDGRIEVIGPVDEVAVPADALRVQGHGRYIAPGLADMHAHPFSAEDLAVYLAAGVTTIRAMWGEPSLLRLRDAVQSEQLPGPRIYSGGRLVCGSPPYFFGTTSVTGEADAKSVVSAHIRDGYDFVKIYEKLTLPAFDAIARETRRQGTTFAGHVPQAVMLEHAMSSGMRSAEHLFGYVPAVQLHPECVHLERWFIAGYTDAVATFEAIGRGERRIEDEVSSDKIDQIAALAARNDFWTTPTLVVLRAIVGRTAYGPDHHLVGYMPAVTKTSWQAIQKMRNAGYSADFYRGFDEYYRLCLKLVRALQAAGAGILAGTDAPNPGVVTGFSIVDELVYLSEAGLSNAEVLRTATLNPARFFGAEGEFGTVAEGRSADLLLLDQDPLQDLETLRNPLGVMCRGQWRDRRQIAELLEEVQASHSRRVQPFADAPRESEATLYAFASNGGERMVLQSGPQGDTVGWISTDGSWNLVSDDRSAEAGPQFRGLPSDLIAARPCLAGLGVGEERTLHVQHRSSTGSIGCVAWRVKRSEDTVIDGPFYYVGVRVYQFAAADSSADVAPITMWIGGGHADGEPMGMRVGDTSWHRAI